MKHYRIKCVHCMKTIKPEDIVFYEKDIIEQLTVSKEKSDIELQKEQYTYETESITDAEDDDFEQGQAITSISENATEEEEDLINKNNFQYVTIEKLKNQSENFTPVSANNTINFEDKISDEIEGGDVIDGFEVTNLTIKSKNYSGKFVGHRKYCPYCQNLLLHDSGHVPTFIVGMIGHSDSGKTIFLMVQAYLISTSFMNIEIEGGQIFPVIEYSHLKDKKEDTIDILKNAFTEKGSLPSTNQAIPEPHCISIRYRSNKTHTDVTKCIICFRDVIGEIWTQTEGEGNAENRKKVIDSVQNADGLFVFTDPEVFSLDNDIVLASEIEKINHMYKNITNIFDSMEPIKTPTVCILNKQDILSEFIYQNNSNRFGNIKKSSPIVSKEFSLRFDDSVNWARDRFERLHNETKKVIQIMATGTNWLQMLEDKFLYSVCIPVSSIGTESGIIVFQNTSNGKNTKYLVKKSAADQFDSLSKQEKKEYQSSFQRGDISQLNPRFVEQPLLYLLDKFHIIPPIHDSNNYKTSDKNGIIDTCFAKSVYHKWLKDYALELPDTFHINDTEVPPPQEGIFTKIKNFLKKIFFKIRSIWN